MRTSRPLAIGALAASLLPACQAERAAAVKGPADAQVAVAPAANARAATAPHADAHALVFAPQLPESFPPGETARLQTLIDEYLGAHAALLEARGLRLVPATTRDRIASVIASSKLRPDGPTCSSPPSAVRVMRQLDAPRDLAVALAYLTKTSTGRDELVVEVRMGHAALGPRDMAFTSELGPDHDLARAVANLESDPNAPFAPVEGARRADETGDPYVKALCAFGKRPWVDVQWSGGDVEHGRLSHAKLHRCITRGRPELAPDHDVSASIRVDLAADGRVEGLRVSDVGPDVAACVESALRDTPFSCPASAGTAAGTLTVRTAPSNTSGCGAGLTEIGARPPRERKPGH